MPSSSRSFSTIYLPSSSIWSQWMVYVPRFEVANICNISWYVGYSNSKKTMRKHVFKIDRYFDDFQAVVVLHMLKRSLPREGDLDQKLLLLSLLLLLLLSLLLLALLLSSLSLSLSLCSICWSGHCRGRVIFIRSRSVSLIVQFIAFCYLLSSFDTRN